jgi:hypothetical protein
MAIRTIIGGVCAGVAMFIWGAVSHMALGLEESTIKEFPDEEPVISTLKANIKEPGFYGFPGMLLPKGATKEQTAEAEKKWTEKYQAGPRGILVYRPDGEQALSPKQLGLQFVAETIVALIAAIALSQAVALKSYVGRLAFVTMLGLLPFFMINFPHWNWYGFPTDYTLIQLADKLLRLFVGGSVLAAIIKPVAPPAPATDKVQPS